MASSMKSKLSTPREGPKAKGRKKEKKNLFLYGKLATLGWDPNRWRWSDGGRFLNYTTKGGRETIVSRNPGVTRVAKKWQAYFPGNYRFYWF